MTSQNRPGVVLYVDADTGDISHERPPDFKEAKPVWEKVESKMAKGVYYYHNHDSGLPVLVMGMNVVMKTQSKMKRHTILSSYIYILCVNV